MNWLIVYLNNTNGLTIVLSIQSNGNKDKKN